MQKLPGQTGGAFPRGEDGTRYRMSTERDISEKDAGKAKKVRRLGKARGETCGWPPLDPIRLPGLAHPCGFVLCKGGAALSRPLLSSPNAGTSLGLFVGEVDGA
jgi:hypothetical protein